MTQRVLVLASHAVAEFDDVRMLSDLGYDVFAPGGYENPSESGEGIRPALPDAPHHPELVALCNEQRAKGTDEWMIDRAKADLHPDLIDWADAIIVHHFPERWIAGQWDRISHKRVIWRTCGQSNPGLEAHMANYAGLQVVRYSPKEKPHFERHGHFAGQDALIRFGKYPDDYGPWTGDNVAVGNVTQDLVQRGNSVGLPFWKEATTGLITAPAGKGSEALPGGVGLLPYDVMLAYLRHLRVYLYTGTQPASYTLGLMEAMLSGVPVVSVGGRAWAGDWDGADLFEGDTIASVAYDNPDSASRFLRLLLEDEGLAAVHSQASRRRAVELFDVAKIGKQWVEFLGSPTRERDAAYLRSEFAA